MDAPQENSRSLAELAGARRDVGAGSPRGVTLIGEVILELHLLLGRELAVLLAVVVVRRLLDRRPLRIERSASLDDEYRHQHEKREYQAHLNRVAHQRILATHR